MDALQTALIAACPLDLPLPPQWTMTEYVVWSARIAGRGQSAVDARARARDAIERLRLTELAAVKNASLSQHARRATLLAAAIATGAGTILVEDPTAGLGDEVARTYAKFVAEALEGLSSIVFATRLALTSPLALSADDAVVVSAARVEAHGPPAEIAVSERRFLVRIVGSVDGLAALITGRGGKLEAHGAYVLLDLGGSLTTGEVLGMTLETGSTILELRPLSRALA